MTLKKTFTSPDLPLLDLLGDIEKGKIRIPEFQRGWIWDDEHIRCLLASISMSYPIGALMMLEAGNPTVRFRLRLLEGVECAEPAKAELLVLDGQQRLTSLYQSLFADVPANTKDARGRGIERWYYIDMDKALHEGFDREEAIVSLPADRMLRNFRGEVVEDYSTAEREYDARLFPLSSLGDYAEWRAGYNKHWNYESTKIQQFDEFERQVLKRFEQYQVPVIILDKETPKEAVCQVFERVNTGGVPLTVFELLTATYAADDFPLREDWDRRRKRLREHSVLSRTTSDDFIQTITLLAAHDRRTQALAADVDPEKAPGVSCRRKDILALPLTDYLSWADRVGEGFTRVDRFLHLQKVFTYRDVPYRTQLVPLAAILTILEDEADNDGVRAKLAQWYWCGVLGELYGSAVESRFARDLPEVLTWISNGPEPSTVAEATFTPARLLTLRTRNSAAYKGLHALLLREGALDFRTGEPIDAQMYFDERIDIHHIFPQAWCRRRGLASERYDSIVNKTPISAKTNRIIGGNAPSAYLPRLESRAGIDTLRMDEILRTHVVDLEQLRSDAFDAFFAARQQDLLTIIESAMGKAVMQEAGQLEFFEQVDEIEEDEEL